MPSIWNSRYTPAAGESLYARYRSKNTLKVWSTVDEEMVDWVDGDVDDYAIAATYGGGSVYKHVIPDDLPADDTYLGIAYIQDTASPNLLDTSLQDEYEFYWRGAAGATPPPGAVSWYYADQTALEAIMGTHNLEFASNQENTSPGTVTSRILRAGMWADAKINQGLRDVYDVPFISLGTDDAAIITDINVTYTVSQLVRWRIVQYAGENPDSADSIYRKFIDEADQAIDDLFTGRTNLAFPRTATSVPASPAGNDDATDIDGRPMYPKENQIIYPVRRPPVGLWFGVP